MLVPCARHLLRYLALPRKLTTILRMLMRRQIIRQLCNTKETVFLRVLCSELAQKPQSLDILLLFEKITSVLEPLCQLLDTWRYDDPEGEYQPIYEEFGGIMLLVLAFVYRYNLTPPDIGITSPESVVAKILTRAHIARDNDELVGRENAHMNGWIHGLFDTESGGLGDELMSSCPPQEFYLLVASIFQSTVVAYTFGYINDEQLKSGIECWCPHATLCKPRNAADRI